MFIVRIIRLLTYEIFLERERGRGGGEELLVERKYSGHLINFSITHGEIYTSSKRRADIGAITLQKEDGWNRGGVQ